MKILKLYSIGAYKSFTLFVMVNALSLMTTIFPFDKVLKKYTNNELLAAANISQSISKYCQFLDKFIQLRLKKIASFIY